MRSIATVGNSRSRESSQASFSRHDGPGSSPIWKMFGQNARISRSPSAAFTRERIAYVFTHSDIPSNAVPEMSRIAVGVQATTRMFLQSLPELLECLALQTITCNSVLFLLFLRHAGALHDTWVR